MIRALPALLVVLAAVGVSAVSATADLWIGAVLAVAGVLFVTWGARREWVQQRDAVRARWRHADHDQEREPVAAAEADDG